MSKPPNMFYIEQFPEVTTILIRDLKSISDQKTKILRLRDLPVPSKYIEGAPLHDDTDDLWDGSRIC